MSLLRKVGEVVVVSNMLLISLLARRARPFEVSRYLLGWFIDGGSGSPGVGMLGELEDSRKQSTLLAVALILLVEALMTPLPDII